MKRIYLLLITIFCCGALWGQCPSGIIYLAEQSDVDDFALNYPECTEILGELRIGGVSTPNNINDLSPLADITSVNGFLRIYNTDIISLAGLENITSIGGLKIFRNDALNSLVSLENITSIDESIFINRNDALTSLVGLENITSVGDEVFIDSNDALISLAGLENLTSINGRMTISNNYALTSLTGLENITSIGSDMTIRGNSILTSLAVVENISFVGGDVVIWYNDSLTSLMGLDNISSIGGSLSINSNNNLTSLAGLENLTSMGGILRISDNKSLKSLDGLDNIDDTSITDLIISNNDSLSFCNITSVCNYLLGNSSITIYNNAPECENLLIVASYCSPGDCPLSNLNFTSQQQIDNFPIDYPNCTEIVGNIIVGQYFGTTNITNLNGLSQIETVGGDLYIRSNESLSSLSGIENIDSIGGDLNVYSNENLNNLIGLENIIVNGSLIIERNDKLVNLMGLENINFGGSLHIYSNSNLISLAGIEHLTNIAGSLSIGGNPNLIDLTGLENLVIGSDLFLYGNDSLIDLAGIENVSFGGGLSIADNDNLTKLTGIEHLTIVTGNLTIRANNVLTDITALEGLQYIGGDLEISSNDVLADLTSMGNIEQIGGDFTIIANDALTDLTGLGQLNVIGGDFCIGAKITNLSNPIYSSITNLSGLQNLDTIRGGLLISRNANLVNLTGLENLNYVGQNLEIYRNSSLENLAGLENLNTIIGNIQIGGIKIEEAGYNLYRYQGNPILASISELESLNSIQGGLIHISHNPMLSTLSILENIDIQTISQLDILKNSNLSICNTTSICNYLENGGSSEIFSNAPGCSSAAEILQICIGVIPCLDNGIIFSTQQQIDSFATNYPNCIAISGDVIIKGESPTAITNLNGLNQITYISDKLIIQDNAVLINLSGLQLLTAAEGGIHIDNNDALQNLYALSNVTSMQGELIIRNNAILTGLNGLHNITGPMSFLRITDNPQLRYCVISSICNHLWTPGFHPELASVYGNVLGNYDNPACGTVYEIGAHCPQYLPIELTHFQAKIQQKTTLLTWQTATETHNSGFEVQRSKDGTTWQKIGWQDGQGDAQTPHDYTHTDENLLSGTSYYRLKQIDFDGTFSHSDVVKVDYVSTGISIYPNPVKNTLHIADLNDNTIQNITIFDQMGRQILLQNTSVNTLDVSALSSGVYIIQVVLDSGVFQIDLL